DAALGSPGATPGWLPAIVDRDGVSLAARPVDLCAVALDVEGGAAADDRLEFVARQVLEWRAAHLARPKGDSPRHLAVEPQAIVGRRGRDRHLARGTHHSATNVKTYGAHRHRTGVGIREQHGSNRHAVSVVHVGGN